jgi:hypothetical protein
MLCRGFLITHFLFFTPKSPKGDLLIYRYLKSPPWGKFNLMRHPLTSHLFVLSVNNIDQNKTQSAEEEDHCRIIGTFLENTSIREDCPYQNA